MSSAKGEPLRGNIHAGDVSGSGIVIGHCSSASVGLGLPSAQRDAIELLGEFIRLLDSFEDAVPDAADVHEAAEAAKAEAEKPSPRWGAVRGLLKGIAASVAGISALTDAIRNIQDLVAHLAR